MILCLGLMSGTSVDGVDAALVRFSDDTTDFEVVAFTSTPYPEALRTRLLALIDRCPAVDADEAFMLDREVGAFFARCARELVERADVDPAGVDAIGSHGQTLLHRPRLTPAFTWQIGCPATIAQVTGIPVVADFRRADIAAGGEGAPLAPAFHAVALSATGEARVIVNLGGIANVTLLPADADGTVTGFDTGPANTLLDLWARRHLNRPFDEDGRLAASGRPVKALIEAMLGDPFFAAAPPKSTGTDYFDAAWLDGHLLAAGPGLAPADVQATLVEVTALSIADALARARFRPARVLVAGGGAENPALMAAIGRTVGVPVHSTADYGLPPDRVEAVAFAWLAARRLKGLASNLPSVTGATRAVSVGGVFAPPEGRSTA